MMDTIHNYLWRDGQLRWWEIVGWTGNLIFSTRFFVQWYATEKKKRVVVPLTFWWLSVVGSLLLLAYAAFGRHSAVFTASYLVAWIPYVRNIIIHHRHANAQLTCPGCGAVCPPKSNYCAACGQSLAGTHTNKEAQKIEGRG